jgi:spermidine synthase
MRRVYEPPTTLARGEGRLGELVLRRRGSTSPIYELIVNGVFLMDTAETSTERLLAIAALQRSRAPRNVVVGGLGLGYTVKALLADQRIERVDVIEIEPLLVDWLRADLVPGTAAILSDRRVRVSIGDVAGTFADAAPGSYDVALLDVDNGPDFLVHERNATVYQEGVLSAAGRALRPGGILAVWSAAPSASLFERLAATVGPVEEVTAAVTRGGRALSYSLYLATATPADR